MFERVGKVIVGHPRKVLVALFLLTAGAAALLPGVRFDFTPQALFEQQDEVNDFARSIRDDFGDTANTLLIIWRADSIYDPETLTDIATVTEELEAWAEEDDRVVRVTSLANTKLPRNRTDETGERVFDVGPLIAETPVTKEQARRIRADVEDEPLLERMIVSPDGDHAAIAIELGEEARNINVLRPLVGEFQDRVGTWSQELPTSPDIELSGLPQVRVDIIRNLQQEQLRFLPLTAILMLGLLAWMFRRASGVLLPMGSIGLALIWTVAFLVLVDQPINIVNSVLPTLLMIIGLSDGIHLLSRAAEEAATGVGRQEIIKATVRRIGLACLLTSMTTAIGFGSLIMSRTEILQKFGVHTAVGVLLAYLATILFIPAMLIWMKPPSRSGMHAEKPGLIERLMARNARLVLRAPAAMVVVGIIIGGVALAAGWAWGRVDTRLLEVYPEGHPTAELVLEVNDEFAGVLPLVVSIDAREPGYFEDPENLEALHEMQTLIEESDPELVLKTASIYDMLQVFRAAYLDDPSLRDEPFSNPREIQTVLELYRRDAAEDVNRLLGPDNSHAVITVRLDDMGIQRGRASIDTVQKHADRLFGEGASDGIEEARTPTGDADVQVRLAGDVYLASVGLSNFIYDLLGSLGLASVLIFFAMTLLFRSVRIGLISVLPNALPLVMTFGYMSARGIELNTSTVIIFSVSLGLAVDDTIHFLTRYEEERLDGYETPDALRRAFLGAGRAIIITSIVLLGGLLVLLSTNFNPTRYFAELTACTVVGAIIGDLFLLPAALLLFDNRDPADVGPVGASDLSGDHPVVAAE